MNLILCYQCGTFVGFDSDSGPHCKHNEDEATTTKRNATEVDQLKLKALGNEMSRDEPRMPKATLQSEFVSIAAKTKVPDELPTFD